MRMTCVVFALLTTAVFGEIKQVGIAHFPPLIIIDNDTGEISGSDFDTFELLVGNQGWKLGEDYEYKIMPSFSDLMNAIEKGEVDIALDGISITENRLRKMEFTQPYKLSGQRILIPPPEDKVSVLAYINQFFRMDIGIGIFVFALNLTVFGLLLWFVERKHKDRNIKTVGDGSQAAFDVGTTIGFGRYFPVTVLGNVVAGVCFITTALVLASLFATLTTNKLVQTLETTINGPEDLQGKSVAVVRGTTTVATVKEYNPSKVTQATDFYHAVVEMRLGNVEAVVADDPVVLNYVKEHADHAATAGLMFHPEHYGIALSKSNVDLVKTFSIGIAQIREAGKLSMIDRHWFGE